MIEFIERFHNDGTMSSRLHADGLPAGMTYNIVVRADGRSHSSSKAYGNGSVRYYWHQTYAEALAHGFKWAQRKVKESRRA